MIDGLTGEGRYPWQKWGPALAGKAKEKNSEAPVDGSSSIWAAVEIDVAERVEAGGEEAGDDGRGLVLDDDRRA